MKKFSLSFHVFCPNNGCFVIHLSLQNLDESGKSSDRSRRTRLASSNAPTVIPAKRIKAGWLEDHMRFKTMVSRGADPEVLLVGDSLVKGLARYSNVWRKYFGSMQCLNFGIGGDRVQHVLWRLRHGELNCDPTVIVIHCGTNNIGKDTPKQIAEGLLTIVDQIDMDCPYTRTIVTGLLPRDLEPSDFRHDIAEVNKLLLENIEFSDEMRNVFFLEPDKDWILASGRLDESLYFTDCLHLVEAGDEKFAKGIKGKIDEVLKIIENEKVLFVSFKKGHSCISIFGGPLVIGFCILLRFFTKVFFET